jgi:hypothetical protein
MCRNKFVYRVINFARSNKQGDDNFCAHYFLLAHVID